MPGIFNKKENMKENLLLQQVIQAYQGTDSVVRRKAIDKFKAEFTHKLTKYAKDQFGNDEVSSAVNKSFEDFLLTVIGCNYIPDEVFKSLKDFLLIDYYEEKLYNDFKVFLSHKDRTLLSTERKLRKVNQALLNFLSEKHLRNELSETPEEEPFALAKLSHDWINEFTFNIYLYKILSGERNLKHNRTRKLKNIVTDSFAVFMLRFSQNKNSRTRIEGEIGFNVRLQLGRFEKEMKTIDTFPDIFSRSLEILLNKLKESDTVLKTTIIQFWLGILRNQLKEGKKEINPNKSKVNIDDEIDYSGRQNLREEIFAFIQEGLEAIKDVHGGKAMKLLLTGRPGRFTIIVMAATFDNIPDWLKKSPDPDYGNKASEAQQRQDCKKALVQWMNLQVDDPESNWYGNRGRNLIDFICKKPGKK
ncbi:hypothetical protein SAMN04515674_101154 [Pseudarcicella hirudinis]|uniref:Uncharacterized protein n=2 Tax=Pseudarcicella hirudinis TaxID=1079859 RepID=A0A1I5M6H0_9BACT|nr:hypothetical protein SAMN04515674_101154 [Pseudarcicella hirudinis]